MQNVIRLQFCADGRGEAKGKIEGRVGDVEIGAEDRWCVVVLGCLTLCVRSSSALDLIPSAPATGQ